MLTASATRVLGTTEVISWSGGNALPDAEKVSYRGFIAV
jgi:hypothetical protein